MKHLILLISFLFLASAFSQQSQIGFGHERPADTLQAPAEAQKSEFIATDAVPIKQESVELTSLKKQYKENAETAIAPVAKTYASRLNALLPVFTEKRRFDDCATAQKEIDYITAKYLNGVENIPEEPVVDKVPEVAEQRKQFLAYSKKAIVPITEKHIKALDELSVRMAKAKDFENAKMIQTEIADIKNSNTPPSSPLQIRVVALSQNVGLELCYCPAGTFMMGSPVNEAGRNNDETLHSVTLTNRFWMGRTEVTQAQWQAVMGNNPSEFKGNDLPVEMITGNAAVLFCKKLTRYEARRIPNGYEYRLPTEAEWEYACRAGNTGPYAGNSKLDGLGWYKVNSEDRTHPVGQKKPNAWGLHDMLGNVREWCQDSHSVYPVDAMTNPIGLILN